MYKKETIEAVELLKKMIEIPSLSREEEKVADLLESFIKGKGLIINRINKNIYIADSQIDTSKKTILLNSHIDTVKPVSGWKLNPFEAAEKDGKVYGLGSNDAGASVVSLLETYFILLEKTQSYNLIFLASVEEEISGKNGVEAAIKELPKIDFAIVGEPTEMKLAIAEKGLMVLDCTANGKAGHAARNEGVNAIYEAYKDIKWFKTFAFERKSEILGEMKMSVTQINAGTQHNVIPDKCNFVVDVRSNELYTNDEIVDIIKENVSCEVAPRSRRLNSSKTPENHPIIKKAKELGIETYGSPTLSDQSLMPFASVKIGPGKSERSHTAEEFIYIDEIQNAIRTYVDLLDGLEL